MDSSDIYLIDLESVNWGLHDVYGSRLAKGMGHAKQKTSLNIDYFSNNMSVFTSLEELGLTKLVLAGTYPSHLVDWFGAPKFATFKRRTSSYNFYFFSTGFENIYDNIEIINPARLTVNVSGMDFIPIYYHPFWQSDNAELYNNNGFIGFNSDEEFISLNFNTLLFTIGNIISILFSVLTFYLLRTDFLLNKQKRF